MWMTCHQEDETRGESLGGKGLRTVLRLLYVHDSCSIDLVLISYPPAVHNGYYQEARVLHMCIAIVISRVVGGGLSPARRSHPAGSSSFASSKSLVISTTIAAKNFLLMQKRLALYVKASVPKNDDFKLKNIKSCGMSETGNATTAYPKRYDAAPR